ncbi:MAG TPA: hypothetical protein VK324_13285 [Tepidisphaeraceae bacterium]|nr:hypothetical protein [Tepidisphaeraceae bacterium]
MHSDVRDTALTLSQRILQQSDQLREGSRREFEGAAQKVAVASSIGGAF